MYTNLCIGYRWLTNQLLLVLEFHFLNMLPRSVQLPFRCWFLDQISNVRKCSCFGQSCLAHVMSSSGTTIVGANLLPILYWRNRHCPSQAKVLYLHYYTTFFLLKLLFASNHLGVLQVVEWGADGVIIGSAIVKILGEAASPKEGLAALEKFTNDLKSSIPWGNFVTHNDALMYT